MSSRMRVTRGHTGRRRAHHHIKEPRLSECSNCGALHIRHRACRDCGFYRGKMVVDIIGKKQAKMEKLARRKAEVQSDDEDKDLQEEAHKNSSKKKQSAKKTAVKKNDNSDS